MPVFIFHEPNIYLLWGRDYALCLLGISKRSSQRHLGEHWPPEGYIVQMSSDDFITDVTHTLCEWQVFHGQTKVSKMENHISFH